MYKFFFLVLSIGLLIDSSCSQTRGNYNFSELLELIDNEKEYFKRNHNDSFNLNKAYIQLEIYRDSLLYYTKDEGLNLSFDSAFIIEHFSIYKEKKEVYYYPKRFYSAIIFIIRENKNFFYEIDISPDFKEKRIRRVPIFIFGRKKELIKWLTINSNYERLNENNRFVNPEVENYLIVSKLTGDERFCRVEFNPMWSLMSMKDHSDEQLNTAMELEGIADLYCLTGNGGPY